MSSAAAASVTSAMDRMRLKSALIELLGLPSSALGYNAHSIVRALLHDGIIGFNQDFVLLTEDDIDKLVVPPTALTPERDLPRSYKNQLKCLLSFFHHKSREAKMAISFRGIPKEDFDEFRLTEFDPSEKIEPWFIDSKEEQQRAMELKEWSKTMKPSSSDFKEFKDQAQWKRQKEKFEGVLQSKDLQHLIDDKYVPTNPELYKKQQRWLYQVLQDKFLEPTCRKIIVREIDSKDTVKIWTDICKELDGSMTTELRSGQLSAYLTSVKLHEINWRGTQESFILHFKEQARQHTLLNSGAGEAYTENQLINFLKMAVLGTPNLRDVYEQYQLLKDSGSSKTWTFEEYIQHLVNKAQVYDGAHKGRSNPTVKRIINAHDVLFEDEENIPTYEANVHDVDTPFEEILINVQDVRRPPTFQGNGPPRNPQGPYRVMLNRETFTSLTTTDQKGWDTISQDGKEKIINYGINRGKKLTQSDGNGKMTVNNTEQIFDDDLDDKADSGGNSNLEVNVNDLVSVEDKPKFEKAIEKEMTNLDPILKKSNDGKDTSKNPHKDGIDINVLLSHPANSGNEERRAMVTELYYARAGETDTLLEINAHEYKSQEEEDEAEFYQLYGHLLEEEEELTYEATQVPFRGTTQASSTPTTDAAQTNQGQITSVTTAQDKVQVPSKTSTSSEQEVTSTAQKKSASMLKKPKDRSDVGYYSDPESVEFKRTRHSTFPRFPQAKATPPVKEVSKPQVQLTEQVVRPQNVMTESVARKPSINEDDDEEPSKSTKTYEEERDEFYAWERQQEGATKQDMSHLTLEDTSSSNNESQTSKFMSGEFSAVEKPPSFKKRLDDQRSAKSSDSSSGTAFIDDETLLEILQDSFNKKELELLREIDAYWDFLSLNEEIYDGQYEELLATMRSYLESHPDIKETSLQRVKRGIEEGVADLFSTATDPQGEKTDEQVRPDKDAKPKPVDTQDATKAGNSQDGNEESPPSVPSQEAEQVPVQGEPVQGEPAPVLPEDEAAQQRAVSPTETGGDDDEEVVEHGNPKVDSEGQLTQTPTKSFASVAASTPDIRNQNWNEVFTKYRKIKKKERDDKSQSSTSTKSKGKKNRLTKLARKVAGKSDKEDESDFQQGGK